MPFDTTSFDLTPAMKARMVIAALRDPTLRPVGFRWDYSNCPTCAVGLTGLMFSERGSGVTPETATLILGLNTRQADRVFSKAYRPGERMGQVPAARVADILEACVAENEAA